MPKHYCVAKVLNNTVVSDFDVDSLSGLTVKPKNKIDAPIKVSEAKIINPMFVENILIKKNEKKIEYFLKYLMTLMNDDDSGEEDIILALDELERFRRQIINKQREYLKKSYLKKILDKITIIEEELKRKVIYREPLEEKRRKGR